jgi:peptidoglycan/xylan/chitin deacetylase (PgdA/CDA1 family)
MKEYKKRKKKKIIFMCAIVFVQVYLVYLFNLNIDFISHLNFNSISKVYYPLFKYEIKEKQILKTESNSKSVPILLYHGIVDSFDGSNILVEDFRKQMFALKEAGWNTITLEEYLQFINGEIEISDKSFILTFDDGRRDSYYPVDPILKKLNYKAVIFVIADNLNIENSDYYLSKSELNRMLISGRWEVQSHSFQGHGMVGISNIARQGHYFSNKMWLNDLGRLETDYEFSKRVGDDLMASKNILENKLKKDIYAFAYPYGDYGQESLNYQDAESTLLDVSSGIYSLGFRQINIAREFNNNTITQNRSLIKRISVGPNWSSEELLNILDSGTTKYLPFNDDFEKYLGWKKYYGSLSYSNGMVLESEEGGGNGAAVFLDGTQQWTDYFLEAQITWEKGSNVFIMARFIDDNNYLLCNYSDNNIKIEQKIAGKNVVIKNKQRVFELDKNDFKFGIKAKDDSIECMLDNKIILSTGGIDGNQLGGVGFKIWDEKIGNSKVLIKQVNVAYDRVDNNIYE